MRRLGMFLVCTLLLVAPATTRGQRFQESRIDTLPAAAPVTSVSRLESYRLAAGDAIEIRFLHNPELNEQVQIRPDGRISLQAAGEVRVSGLTVAGVVSRLTDMYRDVLRSPDVTVQVRTFANNRVFVGGEVVRPGMLALVGEQTALGAITEAGGLKPSAKRDEVIVIRRGENEMPQLLKLSGKRQGPEPSDVSSFALEPLDVVLVPESGIARTNRAIDQYVRQMFPGVITAGFTYLFNGSFVGVR